MEICVVGLGRLGSAFAASAASSGIAVNGVDINETITQAINEREPIYDEPGLTESMRAAGDRLTATTDHEKAVTNADATFIFVNTYRDDVDGYSLDTVEAATRSVGHALAGGSDPHLVVLRGTVCPGDTNSKVKQWLEAESGRSVGSDIQLCYWPEFTAIGDVINSMESPAFHLIGEDTPEAGSRLAAFHEEWTGAESPLVRTSITSAEVAKMAVNTYVAMKMSFVNNLEQICENVGADVDEVTRVMSHDSRINGKYFKAGVRYGGPCFPHDNIAFEVLANRANTNAPLASAADEINDAHTDWIAELTREETPANGSVAILGMAFKPAVSVITESQGVELLRTLSGEFDLRAYDREAASEIRAAFPDAPISVTDDVTEALQGVDTAILTLRDDELTDPSTYKDLDESLTLIDPWRVFERGDLPQSISYWPLGRGYEQINSGDD